MVNPNAEAQLEQFATLNSIELTPAYYEAADELRVPLVPDGRAVFADAVRRSLMGGKPLPEALDGGRAEVAALENERRS